MKKTLLVVAIATCFAVSAHAQGAVGSLSVKPMVGGTLTSVVGKDVEGAKMKVGFVAGAEMMYQMSPEFAISVGALYSMQGCALDAQYDPKLKLDYLNIPVLANYYVLSGLAIKVSIKDLCHTVDVSIPVGISYEYKQFVIDARYCFGLTKTEKASGTFQGKSIQNPNNNVRNSVFLLTLGYNIPIK